MGAFIIVDRGIGAAAEPSSRTAVAIARQMGFDEPLAVAHGNFRLFLFRKIGAANHRSMVQFSNEDFAFSCGTFLYRGRVGRDAVALAYEDWRGDRAIQDAACGHYALIVRKGDDLHILTDSFGSYKVYYDREMKVVSSLFLAAATVLPTLTLSNQSVFEYVFNGVVSGDDTLVDEIKTLPIDGEISIKCGAATVRRTGYEVPSEAMVCERGACVEQTLARLGQYFTTVVAAFGENVNLALSAGYDSRLLLALLRWKGVRPRLYVYGKSADTDVRIAQKIAQNEGLQLDVIDKDANEIVPVAMFPAVVERNFFGNDGYVWAGLFNNGAEEYERRRRVLDGAIVINGGGGEILRNFFYLRNKRFRARALLWSFYGRFDPALCTEAFDEESYYQGLEAKVLALVGTDIDPLPRPTIEWLYHNFRCRAWNGRANCVNSWYGYTALPFLERPFTDWASRIPLAFKNHGAFEAELIRCIDRKLAGYPTAYGHDFLNDPPIRRIVQDLTTYWRPPALRRLIFRYKHRLTSASSRDRYLGRPYIDALFPRGIEVMNRFFDVDRTRSAEQFARILSLEYAIQKFGSQMRLR